MYVNGLGFRAIERVTGVNHNTVIRWVKKSARSAFGSQRSWSLPDAPKVTEIPEITEIDELQTFVGKKAARPRVAVRRKGMLAKTKQEVVMDCS